ncbi:MAG: elongation factor P [Bacilli bacterium]|jgi:elongation factor P|nr:elongation factor P [Acholeplasmataceae bacterium]
MILTSDFKTGMTILYEGNIYQIIEFLHVKPGKGQAFVRTKLRNLRTGAIIDYSFNAGEKVEQAHIEKKKMQFVYSTNDAYVFMDNETFEQIEMAKEKMAWESNFLLEGMEVEVVDYSGEILGINLPEKVALEVTESAPAVAGNTATNAQKEVTLETGFVVKVPMFINQGDKIIVSTIDGKYSSRA